MKRTDLRSDDNRIIASSGNVFLDMGFEPAEAEVLALRAEVMIRLEQHLAKQGWTQAEIAHRLDVSQPRASWLLARAWTDFSLDMLVTLAIRAGLHAQVQLAQSCE